MCDQNLLTNSIRGYTMTILRANQWETFAKSLLQTLIHKMSRPKNVHFEKKDPKVKKHGYYFFHFMTTSNNFVLKRETISKDS